MLQAQSSAHSLWNSVCTSHTGRSQGRSLFLALCQFVNYANYDYLEVSLPSRHLVMLSLLYELQEYGDFSSGSCVAITWFAFADPSEEEKKNSILYAENVRSL